MAKIRVDILDVAKYLIALMLLFIIGYCTIKQIEIERQMWAVASSVFTYIFTMLVPTVKEYGKRVNDKIGMAARALISVGLMGVVGWCTIVNIQVGKEVWALISSVITFVYVSQKSGE